MVSILLSNVWYKNVETPKFTILLENKGLEPLFCGPIAKIYVWAINFRPVVNLKKSLKD